MYINLKVNNRTPFTRQSFFYCRYQKSPISQQMCSRGRHNFLQSSALQNTESTWRRRIRTASAKKEKEISKKKRKKRNLMHYKIQWIINGCNKRYLAQLFLAIYNATFLRSSVAESLLLKNSTTISGSRVDFKPFETHLP